MEQIKWFERKFDFSFQQNIFPSIIERLDGTSARLTSKMTQISPSLYEVKPEGKWSIKENIGHLIDLEPIWHSRLLDVLERKEFLRAADLSNQKTDLAQHNKVEIHELLSQFEKTRNNTVLKLKKLDSEAIYLSALHPRLEQPMRIMDYSYLLLNMTTIT